MTTRWAIISLSGIISDRQSHNICSFFLLLQADNQPLIFKFTSFCDALGILVIFYDPYANIFLPYVQIKPPKRTADEAEGSAEAEQPKAKKAKAAKPVCPFDLLWCAGSVFRSQLSGESKKRAVVLPCLATTLLSARKFILLPKLSGASNEGFLPPNVSAQHRLFLCASAKYTPGVFPQSLCIDRAYFVCLFLQTAQPPVTRRLHSISTRIPRPPGCGGTRS